MNKGLYEMIFKRKSFHLFRNIKNIQIKFECIYDDIIEIK